MTRRVQLRYEDPLDRVWIAVAARLGLRVERASDAFATTDGRGTLRIGEPASLDADDCLAQIIFHELCHSLVAGPECFDESDWGLSNLDDRDLDKEHATLRAQAFLAGRYGLRLVLAPTTDHRAFFDELGPDPLDGDDRSVPLARLAIGRASRDPWAPHLLDGLAATAAIVRAALPFESDARALLSLAQPARAEHPIGGLEAPDRRGTCGGCVWLSSGACIAHGEPAQPAWPACETFAPALDCGRCGACCREAFHVVELAAADPFRARHAALVERVDGRDVVPRPGGRCPPLRGDGRTQEFLCSIYEQRPISCRDFAKGGESCLIARRRVGLSL